MRAKPLANLLREADGQHFILEFLLQRFVGEGRAQGLLAGPSVLKPLGNGSYQIEILQSFKTHSIPNCYVSLG